MAPAHRLVFACLLASLVLVGPASAQTDSATISGRVTDETGNVLPGTRVTAVRAETNTSDVTETNASGIYVLRNLRPGVHRLTIEKDGFQTIVVDGLALAVQDVLGRNFTMRIGPVDDVVTVSAETRSLSTSVSAVVDRQLVDHMPLNGRSFQSLIHLAPGVLVAPAGQGMEGQFSVNGQRTNANYLTVDGIAVNFAAPLSVALGQNAGGTLPALTVGGGTNGFVSVDAMQEFRTDTSTYAPALGRTPGAQISIVTRSGSNRFQGTAYDYVRHDALDARNWFNRPPEPEPPMHQQNFGATLGGPVRYDRSFFFLSYEGLRLQQPLVLTNTFYTPTTRANVAPVYRPLVDALPVVDGPVVDPACDDTTIPCRVSLTSSFANPTRFDAYSARFDRAALAGTTMFARVVHAPSLDRYEAFSSVEEARRDTTLVTAGASTVFGRRMLNDFRIGWGRADAAVSVGMNGVLGAVTPPLSSMFRSGDDPADYLASIGLPGTAGVAMGRRVHNESQQLNIVDTFSVSLGRHDLKAGLDYRHVLASNQGLVGHTILIGSFAQLRTGTLGSVGTFAAEPMTIATRNWSLFVQDAWAVRPGLTVTYGLRWDANTAPVSVSEGKPLRVIDGIFDDGPVRLAPVGTSLWQTRYDNVAPRLGATWALTPATVVRGGAGLTYDLGYGGMLGNLIQGFPYNRALATVAAGQPYDLQSPVFDTPPEPTTLGAGTRGTPVAFDPALVLPRTWQWHTAIERQLGAHHTVTVSYVGARGQDLLRPDLVRKPLATGQPGVAVMATRNAGRSRYDALQVLVQRRLSRGLQALGSYTLASARDTESDDVGGNFTGAALNTETAASLSELREWPLTRADFDARHAWSLALSYDLPSPSGGGITEALLAGWSVDALVRGSSPRPINVRIQGVSPVLGTYATQPDVVIGQPIWIDAPSEPGGKALNPDAFTLPAEGSVGTLRRNAIDSPFGINQTDLAVRRRFPLAGRASLEFRAEAFNLFNRPMFGGRLSPVGVWGVCRSQPCTGQQSPNFGTSSFWTLNQGLGGDPLSGGQNALYAIGGSRSIQLSAKLRF